VLCTNCGYNLATGQRHGCGSHRGAGQNPSRTGRRALV
jgi:hypothetical protein